MILSLRTQSFYPFLFLVRRLLVKRKFYCTSKFVPNSPCNPVLPNYFKGFKSNGGVYILYLFQLPRISLKKLKTVCIVPSCRRILSGYTCSNGHKNPCWKKNAIILKTHLYSYTLKLLPLPVIFGIFVSYLLNRVYK